MPSTLHNTTQLEALQASTAPADQWASEVVRHLPEQMQQQARALKAFERSRQIRCASDLVRGLLASVYTVHSFEQLPHLECTGRESRGLGHRLAQTPARSQRLAHVALARSASRLDSRLPVAPANRVATHLAHRWNPFHLSGSARNGLAGAYGL